MATATSTRDRLVAAAVELFSRKGYEATSIADIQVACGLTPGSGALYKHFPSKLALLEEVLRRHVEGIASDSDTVAAAMVEAADAGADDLGVLFRLAAEFIWGSMERDRSVIRITMRDLEPFPDLLDGFWDEVVGKMYRQASELMKLALVSGRIDVADPDATAAVLLASLTYFPILHGMIGRTPGDVDADRYLDAWVDHALRTVGVDDGR